MLIQILIAALFVANLLFIWLLRRFTWSGFIGGGIIFLLPLISVFFDQPRFELDFFWWRIAGVIALVLGFCLLLWAKWAVGKALPLLWVNPTALVTAGPYSYVRHPLYLSLVFINIGWWWCWAAVYSFYFGMFILLAIWLLAYCEDKLILEKQFGNEYQTYRSGTGMFWIK